MPSGASSESTVSRTNRFQRQPGVSVGGANGAGQRARLRDRIGRHPGIDGTPHHHRAGARVDATRQHAGQARDQRAEPVHQVPGQMRPRRVPALAVQRDLDVVGGRGDRPGAHRDPPDRQPRVTVQREDARHPGQHTGRDRVDRTAGHQLLRRLEDQPHPDRQLGHRGQRECRAEQHRGVRIVAAGVRDVGHHRRERRPGPIGHRQRVHVGPQCDARPMLGAEVADQTGAAGQHLRIEARVGQMRRDELRGAELLPAQLRVGVDVPSPGHHVVVVGGQPGVGGFCESHDATRRASCSSTRSRSAVVSARLTTVRASMIAPSTTALSPLGPAAAAAKPG